MDSRKIVFKETAIIAVGELICSGIMVGVFAALNLFQWNVLWGALAGSAVMIANYFFMASSRNTEEVCTIFFACSTSPRSARSAARLTVTAMKK